MTVGARYSFWEFSWKYSQLWTKKIYHVCWLIIGYLWAKYEDFEFLKHVPHFTDITRSSQTFSLNCMSDRSNEGKARIGILSNNQYDCATCDSRIGFGTGGLHDDSNTCGNEAVGGGDNGDKHIKAMGYILVQWKPQGTKNWTLSLRP